MQTRFGPVQSQKSILRYPGGKTRAVPIILPHLEKQEATTLISPFFGGGSIEIAWASKSTARKVKASDLYLPLATFWQKTLQAPQEVAQSVEKEHPISKDRFNAIKEHILNNDVNEDELAAFFYVINRSSFSGSTMSGGMSPGHKRFTPSSIQRLREFHAPNIEVAHADAFEVLESLKDETPEGKMIYLDPPYWLSNQASSLYGTKGDMHKGFDHVRLSELCESLNKKGWKILISYNNDQKVIDAFPNFGVDEVDWTYGMKNVSDETMGDSSEILLYSQEFSYQKTVKKEPTQVELMAGGAQVSNGDSWETACYFASIDQGLTKINPTDERNKRFTEIHENHKHDKHYKKLYKQATKILKKVIELEKQSEGITVLKQTTDNPSDLQIRKVEKDNYGISCKHAKGLKHPETRSFRFGPGMLKEFGGINVTQKFSTDLKVIHDLLEVLKQQYSKFSDLPEGVKENKVISPIRDAFIDMINDLHNSDQAGIIKALHEKALSFHPIYQARGGGQCGLHAINFQGRLNAKKTAIPKKIICIRKTGGVSNGIEIDFGKYKMNIRLKNKSSRISRTAIGSSVTLSNEFWKACKIDL